MHKLTKESRNFIPLKYDNNNDLAKQKKKKASFGSKMKVFLHCYWLI